MDKLRVAATCAVVLMHTVTGVMDITDMGQYPLEYRVFLIAMDLICWSVPVFVMISGYLFLNPAREITFGKMLTKYCRRIVLALFLFGVPYACLEQIAGEHAFRAGMLWNGVRMVLRGESWAHMWYLYLILVLYLLTPAIKWLLARVPRWTVYALTAVLAVWGSILPWLDNLFSWEYFVALPDGAIYFFYYLCGYLFATGRKSGISRRIPEGGALLLALGMVLSRLPGNYELRMAYNYPFTVALALCLFAGGLARSREKKEESGQKYAAFWIGTAELTFAVYLIHPFFLNLLYKFLHVTPLGLNIFLSLPLFYLAALLPAFGAAWVLRRIPVLRKHVL